MQFKSKWITTEKFVGVKPIDVFHKELDKQVLEESVIKNYHVHFRKKIFLDSTSDVRIRISADDYYKLYINGRFVCQGVAPAYFDSYNYNDVNISDFVNEGENIIALHVYYQGLINRVWNSGDNRMGVIADIHSGGKYIGGTDESWRYSEAMEYSGDTTGYETMYLENINFNLKEKNWKVTDFDDKHYINAIVSEDDDHIFIDEPAACIDVYEINPEKIIKLNKTDYFVDFGKEITGQFKMRVSGKKGQKVTIMYGEEADGYDVRYNMRCNCRYIDECTLSGDCDNFEFYDYKAFRYVKIVTDCDDLDESTFMAVVRHHHFEEKCFLKSDIKHLEDIWNLCVHTLKVGVQEGFLDCPTREKGQYLGDFTVSGLAYMYITGDSEIYRKTLWDFARTIKVCKGLMSVAPGSIMQEIADFSLQYPLQVLNYYRYTGDIETLKELYPIVCGVVNYFAQYEREDGLLLNANEKWNLVDWPKNLRDGYDVNNEEKEAKRPCHNVLNAFYIGALKCVDEIKRILGEVPDDRAEHISKSYIKVFYDCEKKQFYDTEERLHSALHSNVLPITFKIAPKESLENIRRTIMEKGLCCGTQFSYFVLKALAAMEAYDDELKLITNETEHSWVNMLREGATTCFEAWGKEQKWNTSLCHPWSCAPIIAIIEDIAGVASKLFKNGENIVNISV